MFVFHSKHSRNRVTVVGEQKDGRFVFAAARTSDKDNFSRKRGIKIASGRIEKGHYISSTTEGVDIKTFINAASAIADSVNQAEGPKRATVSI